MHVAAVVLDVPSPSVVTVRCHMYLPDCHAGAAVLHPDVGAVVLLVDNAYSTRTPVMDVFATAETFESVSVLL